MRYITIVSPQKHKYKIERVMDSFRPYYVSEVTILPVRLGLRDFDSLRGAILEVLFHIALKRDCL
jgi:hypothetical protein